MLLNLNQLKKMNGKINPLSAPHVHVRGLESIDKNIPSVYVSNHISEEDISLLDSALPSDVHLFIREKEVYKNRNILKKRLYTTYKDLNESVFTEMETILSNGVSVFFFPESTISSNGMIMPLSNEVGNFFKKSKPRLYPIHIAGGAYIDSYKLKETAIKMTEEIVISVGEHFYPCTENEADKLSSTEVSHRIYTEMHNQTYYSVEKQNTNLYNEMVDRVKKQSDPTVGLRDENTFLSYDKFLISVNALGTRFDKLLEGEERVGTLMPTSVGYAIALFSLLKNNKTPVILNFTMDAKNLSNCCETASIQTILTSKDFVRQASLEDTIAHLSEHYRIVYLEEVKSQLTSSEKILGLSEAKLYKKIKHVNDEIIFFTSGTENHPKGVILTHDNILANIQQALSIIAIHSTDKIMNVLPMFHSFGMTIGCILPILYGIDVFLFPSPISYKKIPKLIFENQSTIVFGTSTFLLNYAKTAEKHHMLTIRYAIAGAEKLKDETKEIWQQKFGIRIIEGYGATETSPVLALNRPYNHENGSVGQLLPGITHKIEPVEGIVNGGNLLIKGPNVMRGYLIHGIGYVPHEGWYKTGDVIEMNETGHIFIKARLKRFAKLGGEMVSLNQVEQIASDCFGNDQFAAVSIADKRKGEKIILYTTTEELKERTLKRYIKEQKISNLLLPAKIEYIDEIPIVGSGKTDYLRLQELATTTHGKK